MNNDNFTLSVPPRPEIVDPPVWRRILRKFGAAVLLVTIFGWVRLPYETALTREHLASSNVTFSLSMREQVGQLGFLAALSGFRTVVADLLWVEAYTMWERVEYGRMKVKFDAVTMLAPHNIGFWDGASWHMAFNASVAVMENGKQPSKFIREKQQHEYFVLGKNYLERGIANNPDSYLLHQSLAVIYKDKFKDMCSAAVEYAKSAACPNAPEYEKRFSAYALSECPGKEREAWQKLRALYDMGTQEHLPTLEKQLQAMEEKLQLPQEQRVYKTSP